MHASMYVSGRLKSVFRTYMRLSSNWMNLFGYFSEMACLKYIEGIYWMRFLLRRKGLVNSTIMGNGQAIGSTGSETIVHQTYPLPGRSYAQNDPE